MLWSQVQLHRISSTLFRGLAYLHSTDKDKRQIIHRDISPNNIMITTPSGVWNGSALHKLTKVKFIDFGLAKIPGHAQQPENPRTSASRYETPRGPTGNGIFNTQKQYSAPELIEAEDDGCDVVHTAETDVYAAAIVLMQLYEQSLNPWNAKRGADGKKLRFGKMNQLKWKSEVVDPETQHRPKLTERTPSAIQDIIKRCWHATPIKRPTANQVAEQLAVELGNAEDSQAWLVQNMARAHINFDFVAACKDNSVFLDTQLCLKQLRHVLSDMFKPHGGLEKKHFVLAASQCMLTDVHEQGASDLNEAEAAQLLKRCVMVTKSHATAAYDEHPHPHAVVWCAVHLIVTTRYAFVSGGSKKRRNAETPLSRFTTTGKIAPRA